MTKSWKIEITRPLPLFFLVAIAFALTSLVNALANNSV
jgi:hypothetical protein